MPRPRLPAEVHKQQGNYRADRHEVSPAGAVATTTHKLDKAILDSDPSEILAEIIESGQDWLTLSDALMVWQIGELLEVAKKCRRDRKYTSAIAALKEVRMTAGVLGMTSAAKAAMGFNGKPDEEPDDEDELFTKGWDDSGDETEP